MKILHLTDIHGNQNKLQQIVSTINHDLLVLAGDITHFGEEKDLKVLMNSINSESNAIFAVSGNCDYPSCNSYLKESDLSIEEKITTVKGIQFAGLGGSLKCPGKTPNEYPESYYEEKLGEIAKNINKDLPLILVAHQPPHKTKNDKIMIGFHVGSKSIRRFIETYQPVLCLTGHIHEGKGQDFIGKTAIINPGPARNGHFALIEIVGKTPPVVHLY